TSHALPLAADTLSWQAVAADAVAGLPQEISAMPCRHCAVLGQDLIATPVTHSYNAPSTLAGIRQSAAITNRNRG
uniref:hypothetical protein n=1 Tax=Klebsiella variicola TaxID=244366 RepID=UPI001953401E